MSPGMFCVLAFWWWWVMMVVSIAILHLFSSFFCHIIINITNFIRPSTCCCCCYCWRRRRWWRKKREIKNWLYKPFVSAPKYTEKKNCRIDLKHTQKCFLFLITKKNFVIINQPIHTYWIDQKKKSISIYRF